METNDLYHTFIQEHQILLILHIGFFLKDNIMYIWNS